MPKLSAYQKKILALLEKAKRKTHPHGFFNSEHEATATAYYMIGWSDAIKTEIEQFKKARE